MSTTQPDDLGPVVARAIAHAAKSRMVDVTIQQDVVSLLRLQDRHEVAAVVRHFDPARYLEIVSRFRVAQEQTRRATVTKPQRRV